MCIFNAGRAAGCGFNPRPDFVVAFFFVFACVCLLCVMKDVGIELF